MAINVSYTHCDMLHIAANATVAHVTCHIHDDADANGFTKSVQVNFADLTTDEQATYTAFMDLLHHKAEAIVGV